MTFLKSPPISAMAMDTLMASSFNLLCHHVLSKWWTNEHKMGPSKAISAPHPPSSPPNFNFFTRRAPNDHSLTNRDVLTKSQASLHYPSSFTLCILNSMFKGYRPGKAQCPWASLNVCPIPVNITTVLQKDDQEAGFANFVKPMEGGRQALRKS
jgi:hypothetical protein